jgi:Helix-turn-helix domain
MNPPGRRTRNFGAGHLSEADHLIATLVQTLHPVIRGIVREEVRVVVEERLPRWLTVEQASERIGIGPSAVRERIRRGLLPARKWQARWYVDSDEIDRCIADDRYHHPRIPHNSGAARLAPPAPGHKE